MKGKAMKQSKCPLCGCLNLHVKNPDDSYEIYEFECRDGEICFDDDLAEEECPRIEADTETFCNACAWHGRFDKLK